MMASAGEGESMERHINFDAMMAHLLRIVNTVNVVLLFGVLFSWLNLNKYVSFIILIMIGCLTIIASKLLLKRVITIEQPLKIEFSFPYKILSGLSLTLLLIYLVLTEEWILLTLFILSVAVFFTAIRFFQKKYDGII